MAATQLPVGCQPQTPQDLWDRLNPNWLTGYGDRDVQINQQWFANVKTRRNQLLEHRSNLEVLANASDLSSVPSDWRPLLLIGEADPLDFLASVWAALLSNWDMALANPNWGTAEWDAALQILRPSLVWALGAIAQPLQTSKTLHSPLSSSPKILIPTGGTTGGLKFACHTWHTLLVATEGFCKTFLPPINTYCVLPVHHVSGFMQMLRAWLSQALVVITPFKTLETHPPLIEQTQGWHISLVPTQLVRLLQAERGEWLSRFQAVFLGGAPAWPSLLDRAAQQKISLCLSYGMTETAAMVTVLSPADLTCDRKTQRHSSGKPLPHANISIKLAGQDLPSNTIGQVVVRAASVALGYYGQVSGAFSPEAFRTGDLGFLADDGQLYITGRADSKIISGGENVFPAEVEAALLSTGLVKDTYVFGQPDSQWGEAVTAVFVPTCEEVTVSRLKAALSEGSNGTPLLSRYKHPKRWIAIASLPRNAQGKLLKSDLMRQIADRTAPSPSASQAADSDDDLLS